MAINLLFPVSCHRLSSSTVDLDQGAWWFKRKKDGRCWVLWLSHKRFQTCMYKNNGFWFFLTKTWRPNWKANPPTASLLFKKTHYTHQTATVNVKPFYTYRRYIINSLPIHGNGKLVVVFFHCCLLRHIHFLTIIINFYNPNQSIRRPFPNIPFKPSFIIMPRPTKRSWTAVADSPSPRIKKTNPSTQEPLHKKTTATLSKTTPKNLKRLSDPTRNIGRYCSLREMEGNGETWRRMHLG